jgi:hypothetical protein
MEALGFYCPTKSFSRPIFAQHFFVLSVRQVYWSRSPPLWRQDTELRLETPDEAQSQKRTSRWITPSVPRAQRAPSFRAALWRCVGGSRFHAA